MSADDEDLTAEERDAIGGFFSSARHRRDYLTAAEQAGQVAYGSAGADGSTTPTGVESFSG